AAQRTASSWQTMLQIAGGIGLATSVQGVIRGIVTSLEEMTTAVVAAGTKLETLRVGFAALGGGQAQGNRAFNETFQQAQRLGLEFTARAKAYRGFEGAARGTALEGERGRAVFDAVALATRAMGSTSQEAAHALPPLEQMVSKGTVSMEELRRQLGNALPGAFQIAARALGVTTEELNKMVKGGSLGALHCG